MVRYVKMQPVQWLTLCDSWHWDLSQVGLIFDVPYSIFDRIKSNTSATLQLHASLHMSKFTRRAYSKFELGLVAESLTKLRKCHMSYVDILLNFCQICLTNRCKLAWSCSVAVLDLRSNIDYRTSNINPLMDTGRPNSATSNNMKLVHWLLMGGLLHLVQRLGDAARPGSSSSSLYQMQQPTHQLPVNQSL